jgi:hypothetical protein
MIVLERQGARVAILEGVPEKADAGELLKKILIGQ